MESIEFIFAEFGSQRINNGGNTFSGKRLDPSFSSIKKYFPEASITIYSDFPIIIENTNNIVVESLYKNQKREGNRNNDYYKVFGLLNSSADISICIDSDMFFRDSRVRTIIDLTKKFGLTVPINPRNLVKNDLRTDANYNFNEDPTQGLGLSYNCSPVSLFGKSLRGREFFESYCNEMKTNPCRGPLALWRAAWKTGIAPYVLPSQWCLCNANINPNADQFNDSIILHVGHKSVEEKFLK